MKETGQKMHRRTFLKIFGFLTPIILFLGKIPFALAGKWEKGKINYWVGKSFKQNNVDLSKLSKGIIHARINGKWDDYQIQPLSDSFIEWNLTSRLKGLERIKSGAMPDLSGPHSGAVATYGGYRLDSRVTINNAIKGIGCAPRADRVESMIKRLKATIKYSMPEKIDILKSFYQDRNLFDWTKQTSLELYTQPDFETHTFLNLMENPIASIVFLDNPSFEIRAITRLVHPDDRTASKDERNLLEYVNLIHSYFHGQFKKVFILMVFYVIELFDNSPGKMKGIRIVPPLSE